MIAGESGNHRLDARHILRMNLGPELVQVDFPSIPCHPEQAIPSGNHVHGPGVSLEFPNGDSGGIDGFLEQEAHPLVFHPLLMDGLGSAPGHFGVGEKLAEHAHQRELLA